VFSPDNRNMKIPRGNRQGVGKNEWVWWR